MAKILQRHLFRVTAIVDERHHWELLIHLTSIKAMNVESLPVVSPEALGAANDETAVAAPSAPQTRAPRGTKKPPRKQKAPPIKGGTVPERVMKALQEGGQMTAIDIEARLRDVPRPTIHTTLFHLYNDKIARRVGKGVYELIDGTPAAGANGTNGTGKQRNEAAYALLLTVIGGAGEAGIDKNAIVDAFKSAGHKATGNSIGWLIRQNSEKLKRLSRGVYTLKEASA